MQDVDKMYFVKGLYLVIGKYTYFFNVLKKIIIFNYRPIEVDEIVCIRLTEVYVFYLVVYIKYRYCRCSSWSGVLRFGVTNVDPASFRDIELPK